MRLPTPHFRTTWPEYASFALISGVGCLLAWLVAATGLRFQTPAAKHYNSYSCQTQDAAHTGATFRVLDLFRLNTNELADRLCADAEVRARYQRVEVIWMHRDQLDLREIINQTYQLLLTKPELMKRLGGTPATVYAPLAGYQDYVSQLISLRHVPELSRAFFAGKRLGLIDDPNSLSGYQIPKAALQRAHIDTAEFTTVFYKTHIDLWRALFVNEVEVIATYSADYFGDPRIHIKRLDLQPGLSGIQWYLHPAIVNSSIHCRLYLDFIRHPTNMGAPSFVVKPQSECVDAN